jgi:hypothetical protein
MNPSDPAVIPQAPKFDLATFSRNAYAQSSSADGDDWYAGVLKQLALAAIGVALAIAVWATIINWFTGHIEQELAKVPPVKFEVKPLEFQEFDVEGFHRALGIQPQDGSQP